MAGGNFQLAGADAEALNRVRQAMAQSKPRHEAFRINAERRYALWRSYQEFKRSWERSPRDRDDVLHTAKRQWGASLVIPHVFRAVEKTLTRILAATPKSEVEPGDPASEGNVENVEILLDRQMELMRYRLCLHDVAKDGLIYGIGIEKAMWKREWRENFQQLELNNGAWLPKVIDRRLVVDDPWAVSVDPLDFFWDGIGFDMPSSRYAIHRTWKDNAYVRTMVETQTWRAKEWDDTVPWTLEDLVAGSSTTTRDTVFEARDRAAGYARGGDPPRDSGKLHEIWEYHDRDRVITVLDGTVPVRVKTNPFWHGELPFHVYRPTKVPHEMVGIGVPETLEDLADEMNTLRSQRRDNATLKLQQVFAYFDGMVDPDDLKFGPGLAIPVGGDPRELLMPINVGDIPNSSYQEEDRLLADIERVSGVDDSDRADVVSSTATGAQIMQTATNLLVRSKVELLEEEVMVPTLGQFLELDQQKIRDTRQVLGPPQPEEPERRWSWYQLGPAELAGQFRVRIRALSTMPVNTAQERQDGVQFMTLFGNRPEVVPEKVIEYAMRKFDVTNPLSFLAPKQELPMVGQEVLDKLARMGVDPEMIQTALKQWEMEQQARQEGTQAQGPLPEEDVQRLAAIGTPGGQP